MKPLIILMPKWLKKRLKIILNKYNLWKFKHFQKVSFPQWAVIDPSTLCNLRCALCPTGQGKLQCRKMFMSLETFKRVLEEIPTLRHISLFNWGESFLNPQIFEMITLAKKRGIRVSIHSNLSFQKEDDFFAKIVNSGLDSLEVSLDGASQNTYEKYRRGGNFEQVLKNIKKLTKVKKEARTDSPEIFWKFIVNRHNESELLKAQKMGETLGVDFIISEMGLADNLPDSHFDEAISERKAEWLPADSQHIREEYQGEYKTPLNDGPCEFLFSSVAIAPDGKVYPCCFLVDEKNAFGDLMKESFSDIWNSAKFTSARNLFVRNGQQKNSVKTVCDGCQNYRKNVSF